MAKERIAYIDQIKVFLTCLVVAHHAAQAYGPTGGVWVVDDPYKAEWLGQFFFLNASFMMGLYFFISGYFMVFSVVRKSKAQFVQDRLRRLGIPLLFFTLLVFLPFNYLGSDRSMNVLQFLAYTYFQKPPIATGHLWFVASLLAYSFVYILVMYQQSGQKASAKPFRVWYIWVYILALALVSALVRLKYPIDMWRTWLIPVEVAHIPQYLSLFLIGTVFNRNGWLDGLQIRHGLLFLGVAIVAYVSAGMLPASINDFWLTESFIESLLCVGISIFLLVFFRHYMNRTGKLTSLLSENAYGIYLFHVLIVIAIQQLFISVDLDATLKFLLVTVLSILSSLALSALLRRVSWVRRII